MVPPYVENLAPYVPGRPIETVKRELGLSDVVKLASNENPLGPSPRALAAMREALSQVHLYPDASHFSLLKKLAAALKVDDDRIALGSGSNELIELIIRTFTEPQDEAVICRGSFIMYKVALQAHGRRFVEVPMAEGFRYDLEAMAAAVSPKTRLVFLANPDNPTGTAFGRKALEAFYARLPSDCLLVLDEAYTEYVDWPDYPNGLDYLDRWPNLIVLRTFSKAYGLAGIRVGYAVTTPERVAYLNRTRMPFNVSSVAQAAAIAALDDLEHVKSSKALNLAGLQQLTEGLRAMGLVVSESHANFVYLELSRPAGAVYEQLLKRGIIARPLANYDMPRALRVSVGLPSENRRFLRALSEILNEEQA